MSALGGLDHKDIWGLPIFREISERWVKSPIRSQKNEGEHFGNYKSIPSTHLQMLVVEALVGEGDERPLVCREP